MKTKKIIRLIEKRANQIEDKLARRIYYQDWQGARDYEIELQALKGILFDISFLQAKQDVKREKAAALARESASQIDPNYRHPNFGAINYDSTPHLTAQYQDESGEWRDLNNDEPTRHAAELDTLAQTHEALNYCQPLPVEPQEESETVTNGNAWRTLGGFEIVPDLLEKIELLAQKRQQAEEANSQAFRGDPDSDLESFLNYLSQHNGEKLTLVVCHDCHNVVIDTPGKMRMEKPFVFVHGGGKHAEAWAKRHGSEAVHIYDTMTEKRRNE